MHAGLEHAPRAFMKHQRDWRIDELHRARRARGIVGGAMRVAAAGLARVAISVERGAELPAIEAAAMRDQRRPVRRPRQIAQQLARQAERKIETADPRAFAR